jgi:signal peptidase II
MAATWRTLLIVSFIVILDQVTKGLSQALLAPIRTMEIIPHFLHLTYVENPGVAFGYFEALPDFLRGPLLTLIPALICFWLVRLINLSRKDAVLVTAYALILGGAIGNLFDRVALGFVVDFVDIHFARFRFPAFNISDISISTGIIILFIRIARGGKAVI